MRFQLIDDSNIGDHTDLGADDRCCYIFEYTSSKDYRFSETNSLISNLKKKPSKERTHPLEYRYKIEAISRCAQWLGEAINHEWLKTATLVPVPPSKAKGHSEYDGRVVQVCNGVKASFPVDVRELVLQRESIPAAHESPDHRPSVDELVDLYVIDEQETEPVPARSQLLMMF